METWAERMTDRLAALRLTGQDFDACWTVAFRENPPNWRKDFGIRGMWWPEGTLETYAEQQQTEKWLRAQFERAWNRDPGSVRLRLLDRVELTQPGLPGRGKTRAAPLSGTGA